MAEEHAADRAAGEVVFSSDGLPPAPIPTVTKPPDERGDMNVLDTGGNGDNPSTADQAFEVFSGKIYPVSGGGGAAAGVGSPSSETTAERLARLQREVAELEQDLTSDSTTKAAEGEGGDGGHAAGFMDMVSALKTRIEAQAGVAASAKNQEEMTRSIQQHLQDWEAKKTSSAAGSTASKTGPSEAAVVYELYGGVGVSASTSSAPSWEERMLQVEGIVGAGGSSSPKNKQSLLSRLEEMEGFLQQLDPKALEQASARAKVIRSDLEAASKARSKLASAATFRKEDAKIISSLHDQMTQLEGLSGHLPALVARLQQLASLHAQSSSFSVRLAQNEKQVVQLQTLLKHLEDSATKVEAGVVENVTIIGKNMQQLDDRMKKL